MTISEESMIKKVLDFGKNNISALDMSNIDLKTHDQLREQVSALGLTKLQIPKNHGGLGFNFITRSKIFGILSSFDFGFAMSVTNTHGAALRLSQSASASLRSDFFFKIHEQGQSACTAMTEPEIGSDFFSICTTAQKLGNVWKLNGTKDWIVNGRHATLAIVYAQTKKVGNKDGIAGFAIDLNKSEAKKYEVNSLYSQNSMGTGGFHLNNYICKSGEMIVPPGSAYKEILTEINAARVYVGSMCCHMLKKLLEVTKKYGSQRKSFGKKLNGHQSWRFAIAEAELDLTAAKLLVKESEIKINDNEDAQILAAKAKLFATRACQKHFPILMHKMGAAGFEKRYPFTSYIPAIQMACLMDGSHEMLLERLTKGN